MIDIIVPTFGRAHRIADVHADIEAATTVPHAVWFVVERDDVASCDAVDAIDPLMRITNENARSYAGACNSAYAWTGGDWLFAAADDLHFHPGWDLAALRCAEQNPWAQVIGTDDRLNPYVGMGVHATHYLVRRSYLDRVGGVVDEGPGSWMHEGYGHNYVDTEFVGTARARGVFMPCFHSVVEHRHWSLRPETADATTEKENASYGADAQLHDARRHLWLSISL